MIRPTSWAIAALVLLLLPSLADAHAIVSESVAELSRYAQAFDWVVISQSQADSASCRLLLTDLKESRSLRAIPPRVQAVDSSSNKLAELSRCKDYKVAERRAAQVPNNFISGPRDLGDQAFRMYRVRVPFANRGYRSFDIVYAEYSAKKMAVDEYTDGYSVVDLSSCKVTGTVPIQRAMPADQATGATRHFFSGLFELNGGIYVMTSSEQVGHQNDPNSFRAIEAWKLEPAGKFVQACAWSPRTIAGSAK